MRVICRLVTSRSSLRVLGLASLAILLIGSPDTHGQSSPSTPALSEEDQKALKQTQDLLRDKRQREGLKDEQSQKTMSNVNDLMGGDQADIDAIYALSADILGPLVQQANGDPVKMKEILDKAMKDPKSFASKLSPQQQAKIKELAKKIEARKPSQAPR